MSNERTHDVVWYGATGDTGRLVWKSLRDRDPGCRWEAGHDDRLRDRAGLPITVAEAP